MVRKYGLKEVFLPSGYGGSPVNVFMSPEFDQSIGHDWKSHLKAAEKKGALILIQGSGAVRPGYWARSVCINENLDKGSMLPLIQAA